MAEEQSKDLVPRTIGHVLDVLGASAGLAAIGNLPAAAGIASVATAAKAATAIFEGRRQQRRERNAKMLMQSLAARLAKVEATQADEERVDLFAELYLQAVDEDDEKRLSFTAHS